MPSVPPLLRTLSAASLLLALSACAGMGRMTPRAPLLDANTLDAGAAVATAQGAIEWPSQAWWQDLHDPQLNQLLAVALADNPTLHAAQARVRQARALAGLADDHTGPKADASVALNRERYSEHGSAPAPLAGNYAWRNQATLSLSYDLDVWGRNRQALAAALDEVQLAAAESQMARLALQTAVAGNYVQLSFEFERQDFIRAALARRERILDIARRRRQAGLGTEVDVAQIEATLPAGRRELEQAAHTIALLRNQLAALAGKGPADGAALRRPALRLDRPPALPGALPAELIGRRPDIAAQRWRVQAAAKRIAVAKADFYPNLNLLAFAGLQSFGFAHFLEAGAATGGVAPALSLPLFAGARLRAQLGNQDALYDAAVAQYNASVVAALADVANAVAKAQSLQRQQRLGADALATAGRASDLAGKAYRAGLSDAVNLLNSELALLAEQQQTAQIGARQLDSYVSLMAALGGGFGALP
ncbi:MULTISPECIES: efflux transporter outer membrane subunit [unclassified Janthinobacterium]|uniref:efflux transporter outer membrane subunit n=1 Tax=unclassified Janthinobacterium TaxID=2610881 RepID=UPI000346D3EE|nr:MULTISPECIES: efflux transporter outer membrane subunit [unclassified Janthinobacterium]MEC5163484.1 NodT family efflux transporter outer membrane factor (OMF) lipoprotein [Janthinobacterium sp. CG_S6]